MYINMFQKILSKP